VRSAAGVDEIEQLGKYLHGTVVDQAKPSGKDGQERLQLPKFLKYRRTM
jgi:hypothetical protein